MNKIAYDENKIKIMAKLAVYDKRTSENDLKKTSHFRHDYVYKRNSSIRLGVFIGTLIIAVFYALHLATINELDLFILIATGAYRPYFMNLLWLFIALEVIYTVIGTIIYTAEYAKACKRMRDYTHLLDDLSTLDGEETELEENEEYNEDDYKTKEFSPFYNYKKDEIKKTPQPPDDYDEELDAIPEPTNPHMGDAIRRRERRLKDERTARPQGNALVYTGRIKQ